MNRKPVFVLRWQHLVACLVGLLMWAVILAPAWASDRGDDVDVDVVTDVSNQVDVAGDTLNVAGDTIDIAGSKNRAYGFSHSLGDVDINEGQNCLGSEQWGTIIVSRQTNELNPWCAALFYELNGKHEFAAKMRCDIKSIADKYESTDECVDDQTLGGELPAVPPPELAALYDQAAQYDEHQDREEQHELDLARTVARQDELEARLDAEAAARRRAVAAGQEMRDQKRADDYDFAQQQLEQFMQIVEPPTPEGNE